MTTSEPTILDSLTAVFREVFDDETLQITSRTTNSDLADWDSVAQVRLVLAIEERFGIQFTTQEMAGHASVQRFIGALQKRGISA